MVVVDENVKSVPHFIPKIAVIEYWLAVKFDYRVNIIVPNISWGIEEIGHECDLLVLRPSGYAVEIEIKRSMSDLKIDKKKPHAHCSNFIRELWFCVADDWDAAEVEQHVPEHAGILTYSCDDSCYISKRRCPKINKYALRFGELQRLKLLHLAHMRIWSMKKLFANSFDETEAAK